VNAVSDDGPAQTPAVCRWCGSDEHVVPTICPYVKALEFDGTIITRVEFFSPVEMFGPPQRVEAPGDDYPKKRSIA
jgi:hypothetical protein